jgi:acetyltransferase-like isoleucine patch superfamily enzyme
MGKNVTVGKNVSIIGGKIVIGDETKISDGVSINVKENFFLGPRSVLGKNFKIEGRNIRIDAELWSGENCAIGGGSCFEAHSSLDVGYWCHFGDYSFINTARPVKIGNEVGLGMRTSLFTHGAYQSVLDGYPVEFGAITIGDNCWLPGAIVNPGVVLGACTVVGVGSVITRSFPGGCLIAGIPSRIIKENVYPRKHSSAEITILMKKFLSDFAEILESKDAVKVESGPSNFIIELPEALIQYSETQENIKSDKERCIILGIDCELRDADDITMFDLTRRRINGIADELSERLRNQLRRHGVRFKYKVENGRYTQW